MPKFQKGDIVKLKKDGFSWEHDPPEDRRSYTAQIEKGGNTGVIRDVYPEDFARGYSVFWDGYGRLLTDESCIEPKYAPVTKKEEAEVLRSIQKAVKE